MTTNGEGFTAEIKEQKLVITIDLAREGTPSKSGKNMTIATTRGNRRIGDVSIGLNVYRPR